MAKVTYLGSAKPDDPIYSSGPVVGGKRFGKPVFTRIDASMSRERAKRNLVDALEKSGFRVVKSKDEEA